MKKLLRYAGVSVVSTALSLSILGALVATRTLSAGWANLVATAVGTVPSFELNRRWVWSKSGRRSFAGELAPFWALSLGGLGLSTWSVSVAARVAISAGWESGAVAVVSQIANLATFGSLWVLQYFLLDRVLFSSRRAVPEPAENVSHDRVRAEDAVVPAGR